MTIDSSHKAIQGGDLLSALKILAAENGFLMEEDSESARDTVYPAESWENGEWCIWYQENTRSSRASIQVSGPVNETDFSLKICGIPLQVAIPTEILWALDQMPQQTQT